MAKGDPLRALVEEMLVFARTPQHLGGQQTRTKSAREMVEHFAYDLAAVLDTNPPPSQTRVLPEWLKPVEALAAHWRDPEFWKDEGSRMDSVDCAEALETVLDDLVQACPPPSAAPGWQHYFDIGHGRGRCVCCGLVVEETPHGYIRPGASPAPPRGEEPTG